MNQIVPCRIPPATEQVASLWWVGWEPPLGFLFRVRFAMAVLLKKARTHTSTEQMCTRPLSCLSIGSKKRPAFVYHRKWKLLFSGILKSGDCAGFDKARRRQLGVLSFTGF
jgi:hypothetical protein